MRIDKFIEKAKEMPISGKGFNKVCYLFDKYALLCGHSVEHGEVAQDKIERIKELKKQGVNVVCTLETKTIDNKDYELQERASGEALFPYSLKNDEIGELKYLKTLLLISEESLSFYEKMLCDWDAILSAGLDVDPSKCTNFFYQKGGICFIDLNNRQKSYEERKQYQYLEMAAVLRGGSLLWQCKHVYQEANEAVKKIYTKLGEAVLKIGGNIQEYIQQVDRTAEYDLENYFAKYSK